MTQDQWPLAMTILETISAWELDDDPNRDIDMLAAELGEDPLSVRRQVRALYNDGYLSGTRADRALIGFDLMDMHLLPKGMRQIREWPSEDAYAEMIEILERQLSEAEDGSEEKSRLQKLLKGVSGAGRDIFVGITTEALKRGTFGP